MTTSPDAFAAEPIPVAPPEVADDAPAAAAVAEPGFRLDDDGWPAFDEPIPEEQVAPEDEPPTEDLGEPFDAAAPLADRGGRAPARDDSDAFGPAPSGDRPDGLRSDADGERRGRRRRRRGRGRGRGGEQRVGPDGRPVERPADAGDRGMPAAQGRDDRGEPAWDDAPAAPPPSGHAWDDSFGLGAEPEHDRDPRDPRDRRGDASRLRDDGPPAEPMRSAAWDDMESPFDGPEGDLADEDVPADDAGEDDIEDGIEDDADGEDLRDGGGAPTDEFGDDLDDDAGPADGALHGDADRDPRDARPAPRSEPQAGGPAHWFFRPDRMDACQRAIGYHFRDIRLLQNALTHSSIKSDDLPSYERLEFLGDSVVGLVMADYLYTYLPQCDEGEMTEVKSMVVSTDGLANAAKTVHLDRFLAVGRGLMMKNEIPRSLIADVFEGVVGAVYLDRGWEAAKLYVLDHLLPFVERAVSGMGARNFKSVLQKIAQRDLGETPHYDVIRESTHHGTRQFEVSAVLGRRRFPSAVAATKKDAEQAAAMIALRAIQIERGHGGISKRRRDQQGSQRGSGQRSERGPSRDGHSRSHGGRGPSGGGRDARPPRGPHPEDRAPRSPHPEDRAMRSPHHDDRAPRSSHPEDRAPRSSHPEDRAPSGAPREGDAGGDGRRRRRRGGRGRRGGGESRQGAPHGGPRPG